MSRLLGKKVLLGVAGSIAAYKAVEIVRRLQEEGATVQVVMTRNAQEFIRPLTFRAITGLPVGTDLFGVSEDWTFEHLELARSADAFLIAPATANILAKLSAGIADDLLTTVALAVKGPLLVAPAMNPAMYEHPSTQENLQRLQSRGVFLIEPERGRMACGEEGIGRLAEPDRIVLEVKRALTPKDLKGMRVLITAGPTREPVDAVRFLSNPSTGKMGYALAETALARGAEVILVSGPVALNPPPGAKVLLVTTAQEMYQACLEHFDQVDAVIGAAAVSDFRPQKVVPQKIKKENLESWSLPLERNPDILRELGRRKTHQLLVGFAAETENLLQEGQRKLWEKNLDLLVVNPVGEPSAGFASETNRGILLYRDREPETLPLMLKEEMADKVFDALLERREQASKK